MAREKQIALSTEVKESKNQRAQRREKKTKMTRTPNQTMRRNVKVCDEKRKILYLVKSEYSRVHNVLASVP